MYRLGSALNNFGNEIEFLPQPAWTPVGKHKSAALPSVWSSEAPFSNFSSGITCIKKVGRHAPDAYNTKQALYPKFAAASILYIVIVAVIAHNFHFVFSWSLGPLTF